MTERALRGLPQASESSCKSGAERIKGRVREGVQRGARDLTPPGLHIPTLEVLRGSLEVLGRSLGVLGGSLGVFGGSLVVPCGSLVVLGVSPGVP